MVACPHTESTSTQGDEDNHCDVNPPSPFLKTVLEFEKVSAFCMGKATGCYNVQRQAMGTARCPMYISARTDYRTVSMSLKRQCRRMSRTSKTCRCLGPEVLVLACSPGCSFDKIWNARSRPALNLRFLLQRTPNHRSSPVGGPREA